MVCSALMESKYFIGENFHICIPLANLKAELAFTMSPTDQSAISFRGIILSPMGRRAISILGQFRR